MGKLFDLDPETLKIAQDAFDDLLDQSNLGKPCKLVYSSTTTICPNCIVNRNTGLSTNRYKVGGPIPFVDGEICPVCEGSGKLVGTEGFDIVTLLIDWNPKPWLNVVGNAGDAPDSVVRIPNGAITTRGYMTDLPKIIKADYAVMDVNNNYMNNHFVLSGEPISPGNIVKNRYFTAVWKRAG